MNQDPHKVEDRITLAIVIALLLFVFIFGFNICK